MNKEFIYRQLLNILDEESIKVDELMKKHITFLILLKSIEIVL